MLSTMVVGATPLSCPNPKDHSAELPNSSITS